jgi:23S rRNA (uracil1939-C5)-methyltransferase
MKNKILEGIRIIDIADKGKSVGKFEDKTIFIEGAVPGDLVNVEVTKKSKSFDEARVVQMIEPSPWRIEPFCEHFGLCGGCKWQNLQYSAQLQFKEKVVRDAMERIAKLPKLNLNSIAGGANITHYRNKLEFTFTNKRYLLKEEMDDTFEKEMDGLGFHIPGKFNKVLNIHDCYLQDDRSNKIRLFIRDFTLKNQYTYFDLKSQVGLMRNLIIRNTSLHEWMVIVVFKEDDEPKRTFLMNAIKNEFPWITSLQYIVNTKRNDTIHDQETIVYYGASFITEQLENLKFKIGPKSFFQTNTAQALQLYNITRSYAGLSGSETVYDLYTGTGSIAAFISAQAKKVIGVEYVKEAIDDAKENASLNKITNMSFFAGDMKDVLTKEFFNNHGKPDVIITDPPRAGMHENVINRIIESGAAKVVYVSCNPATQARDLLLMAEHYSVEKMQPVDMFPHTSHVENVALLVKKGHS